MECRGRACKLTCDDGALLKGKKSVGCAFNDETGEFEWRAKLGKCITCPDFPKSKIPEGMEIEYGLIPDLGKKAFFSCARGNIQTNFGDFDDLKAGCRCNKKRCRYFNWANKKYITGKQLSDWSCSESSTEHPDFHPDNFAELNNQIDTDLATCSSADNGLPIEERIVNGENANISDWPWIVELELSSGHSCGGSAINDEWILTAAHCCADGDGLQSGVTAHFFDQDFSNPEGSFSIDARMITNHPEYNAAAGNMDFCLLKLDTPISTAQTTKTVEFPCLPASPEIPHGENCWVAGWGALDYEGDLANHLQTVGVHAMSQEYCAAKTADDFSALFADDICAGNALDENDNGLIDGGIDSCQGDSGGPLICPVDGKAVLMGVVSRGQGCASEGYPGLYSNVHFALEWIQAALDAAALEK